MRTTIIVTVSVAAALLLVGCGSSSAVPRPDVSGLAALDAQATLAVWSAQEAAAASATRQAAESQAQAAQAAAAGTAAAVDAANATVAANATGVALDTARMSAEATATWDALAARQMAMGIEATATADAAALAFQEATAAKALAARQAQIDRDVMWNRMLPWLVGVAVVVVSAVVVGVVGVWALPRIWRARPQQAGDTWIMVDANGMPTVLNRTPRALPLVESMAQLPAVAGSASAPVADWVDFARWRSATQAPIGVADGRRPIVLDTRVSPHLFIAGSSRRGKTSGGLVPYVTWALVAGFNVVLLGERAADFGAFYSHPNATHLRAFSDEERVELTRTALESARREMERRDRVLHAARLNTWSELLRREPGEAGQLLIVVDEFLALATMGGTAVGRSMMSNVASLTSQAGKFGIGVVLAATDPRREALGAMGYTAIKQCARMAFGFNDRGSSRSVLGDDAAFNLPPGTFVYEDMAGGRVRGSAFHPSAADVRSLLATRPIEPRALPDGLREIAEGATNELVEVAAGDLDGVGDEDVIMLPGPGPLFTAPAPVREPDPDNMTDADRARVVAEYQRTGSMAAVQRAIFPSYGGSGGRAFYAIKDVLAAAGEIEPYRDAAMRPTPGYYQVASR